jgi:hypothetical protein
VHGPGRPRHPLLGGSRPLGVGTVPLPEAPTALVQKFQTMPLDFRECPGGKSCASNRAQLLSLLPRFVSHLCFQMQGPLGGRGNCAAASPCAVP